MVSNREKLKELLRKLQGGEEVEKLRNEFKDLLKSIPPLEIPLIEQELMEEGISAEEIAKMCDIHVELFRESLAETMGDDIPEGHPLHTLYMENDMITKDAEILNLHAGNLKENAENLKPLKELAEQLPMIGVTHYTREEMLLFPYLERRGITAVPSTLWRKHDECRAKIKLLLLSINQKDMQKIEEKAREASKAMMDMVFRENNILYPTLKELLSEGEWVAIRQQEDEMGYYKVKPSDEWKSKATPVHPYELKGEITSEQISNLPEEIKTILAKKTLQPDVYTMVREGDIPLDTGFLSPEEINAIFKTIPGGITFIDSSNRVRFFSGFGRMFKRTPSVLGRPVQFCHPPKSVHMVNKILQEFREGKRNAAEFWIQVGKKFVYIRYFPVRGKNGEYLGTLEIEQDITKIKNLEGEKRLLETEEK